MRESIRQPGYLLIELIAALTLVAIAVAALLPGVVGRSEATKRSEAVQSVIDLDRRARAAALKNGPSVLRANAEDGAILLLGCNGDPIGDVSISDGDAYLLESGGDMPLRQILFDRLGRTRDYRVLLRSDSWQTIVHFSGVSGVVRTESRDGAL